MKDKKNQIEEMAKDIELAIDTAKKHGWYIKNAKKDGWDVEKLLPVLIAEQISEKYQPKLPKDSVVLSRKEFKELKYFPNKQLSYVEKLERDAESYQKLTDNLISKISQLEKELVNSRKETAERDFNKIIKALEERKDRVKIAYGIAERRGIDMAIAEVERIAKLFDVEIKE